MKTLFLSLSVLISGNFSLAANYIDEKDCKLDMRSEWYTERAIIKGSEQNNSAKAVDELLSDRSKVKYIEDVLGIPRIAQSINVIKSEEFIADPKDYCSEFWTVKITRRCTMNTFGDDLAGRCNTLCERQHSRPDCR